MKIGIITDCIDDGAAGIGRYTKGLINSLKKIDKRNTYVLIHHTNIDSEIYKDNRHLLVPFSPIPFRREIRKIFQLSKILKTNGFDIIHETTQTGPFFLKNIFRGIVTIHDISVLKYPETHRKISYIRERLGIPVILKNADKIIAVSENTKKDLIKYFDLSEEKIKVIYNGIDRRFRVLKSNRELFDSFRQKYNLPSKFILDVATLEPRKNIPTLIKAYHKLKREEDLEHKLVIVGGSGWKNNEIFKTLKKLDVKKEVIFTGYIHDEELPIVYNMADLFVFPSLYEGFGFPPLEAMACGCPVITSNTSSLPEVVGDAGIMIDPHEVDALAKTMYEVLINDKLRKDMVKKGLTRAKLFSWEKVAKATLKVYEETAE